MIGYTGSSKILGAAREGVIGYAGSSKTLGAAREAVYWCSYACPIDISPCDSQHWEVDEQLFPIVVQV